MLPAYHKVKGVHPGAILKRELKKMNLKGKELALSIIEFPQTISAIIKEKRGVNPRLSIKLGKYFGVDEEYFMILQAAYEVDALRKKQKTASNPLTGKFRASLFWDTRMDLIDYRRNKRSIIQRVLERGNQKEIRELIKIYTTPIIKEEVKKIKNSIIPNFKENVEELMARAY